MMTQHNQCWDNKKNTGGDKVTSTSDTLHIEGGNIGSGRRLYHWPSNSAILD